MHYILYVMSQEERRTEQHAIAVLQSKGVIVDQRSPEEILDEYPLVWLLKNGEARGAHGPEDLPDVASFSSVEEAKDFVRRNDFDGSYAVIEEKGGDYIVRTKA